MRKVPAAQRETLIVASTFGARRFTERDLHRRALNVIPGYGDRFGHEWHGRLATAMRKGWVEREPLPKGADLFGARWGYRLTDDGERAAQQMGLAPRQKENPDER